MVRNENVLVMVGGAALLVLVGLWAAKDAKHDQLRLKDIAGDLGLRVVAGGKLQGVVDGYAVEVNITDIYDGFNELSVTVAGKTEILSDGPQMAISDIPSTVERMIEDAKAG